MISSSQDFLHNSMWMVDTQALIRPLLVFNLLQSVSAACLWVSATGCFTNGMLILEYLCGKTDKHPLNFFRLNVIVNLVGYSRFKGLT